MDTHVAFTVVIIFALWNAVAYARCIHERDHFARWMPCPFLTRVRSVYRRVYVVFAYLFINPVWREQKAKTNDT